jgi:predicted nucleotide-binding protein
MSNLIGAIVVIIPPPKKPKLFIGSSREAMNYAQAVHYNLNRVAQVLPWYAGTFAPNEYTMASLKKRLTECDFGVFIFSPDDVALVRGEYLFATRDNTIFEAGLFIGRLGLDRVFCLVPNSHLVMRGKENVEKYHVLSDLSGITLLTYEYAQDDEYQAAVSVACGEITQKIEKEGFFEDHSTLYQRYYNIAELFWEYIRWTPISSNCPPETRYHALTEGIRSSFSLKRNDNSKVLYVALYRRRENDGMEYISGNVDQGAFYRFGSYEEKTKPAIIQVQQSGEWTSYEDNEIENRWILCYPLGLDHVLSITIQSTKPILSSRFQAIVDDNVAYLTYCKKMIGGGELK